MRAPGRQSAQSLLVPSVTMLSQAVDASPSSSRVLIVRVDHCCALTITLPKEACGQAFFGVRIASMRRLYGADIENSGPEGLRSIFAEALDLLPCIASSNERDTWLEELCAINNSAKAMGDRPPSSSRAWLVRSSIERHGGGPVRKRMGWTWDEDWPVPSGDGGREDIREEDGDGGSVSSDSSGGLDWVDDDGGSVSSDGDRGYDGEDEGPLVSMAGREVMAGWRGDQGCREDKSVYVSTVAIGSGTQD